MNNCGIVKKGLNWIMNDIGFKDFKSVKKYLETIGFKEYPKPKLSDFDNAYSFFQKKYYDNNGVKYFIDVQVFDWRWTNIVKDNFSVEYSSQLYQKGTHDAFNITFIGWNLQQVEDHINLLFKNDIVEYYEERDSY